LQSFPQACTITFAWGHPVGGKSHRTEWVWRAFLPRMVASIQQNLRPGSVQKRPVRDPQGSPREQSPTEKDNVLFWPHG
jgi:hypothetical protein